MCLEIRFEAKVTLLHISKFQTNAADFHMKKKRHASFISLKTLGGLKGQHGFHYFSVCWRVFRWRFLVTHERHTLNSKADSCWKEKKKIYSCNAVHPYVNRLLAHVKRTACNISLCVFHTSLNEPLLFSLLYNDRIKHTSFLPSLPFSPSCCLASRLSLKCPCWGFYLWVSF